MSLRQLKVVLASLLLISSLFLSVSPPSLAETQTDPDVYVGIDVGYGVNVEQAKAAIDRVSDFTNFFVMGTTAISRNLTNLNETLQYAYDKGMYFMSFPPTLGFDPGLIAAAKEWFNYTRPAWGDHLVGFLYPWEDEPGGHQLDKGGTYYPVTNMNATDYLDAEDQFLNSHWFTDLNRAKTILGYPLFTSDYALYWFDYKGGYDGLFAEFAWNHRRHNLNLALCRGAATVQGKQWGVIITLSSEKPPYMESGEDLYSDLVYAYDSGAKYITVFDSNMNWTAGCLTEEHFDALRQFWQYTQNNPRKSYPASERVAYVLPQALAYGFRGPENKTAGAFKCDMSSSFNDKIWGIWETNMETFLISTSVSIMLDRYGSKLDIVYNDPLPNYTFPYSKVIFWNDPQAVAEVWPSYAPWYPNSTSSPPNTTPTQPIPPIEHPWETLAAIAIVACVVGGTTFVALKHKQRSRSNK